MQIDVNKIEITGNSAIGISVSLLISFKKKDEIVNFFLGWNSINNWKLQVFNPKTKYWSKSSCFPSNFKKSSWENRIIMSWISRNIGTILFLGGLEGNIYE